MKIFIDSQALELLGKAEIIDNWANYNRHSFAVHPDLEIRQKSLKELTSVLQNNILFEAEAHQGNTYSNDELQVVNLPQLAKQLIRWFKYTPVTNSDEILDLLILIFSVSITSHWIL